MQIYSTNRRWKFLVIAGAVVISVVSLYYTNNLVRELREEEQNKVALWAEANRLLVVESDPDEAMVSLIFEIIRDNNTVPVILTDNRGNILSHRNIKLPRNDQGEYLKHALEKMKKFGPPLEVDLGDGEYQYLYYQSSNLLTRLRWFPIVQLVVVFVFMVIAYIAFSATRRREEDQVWVGMARETAHQLGTPTSSLLAWLDLLKMKNVDENLLKEMRHDIGRLQTVASRFSKIGSRPDLLPEDIGEVVTGMIGYLRKRSSSLVRFNVKDELVESLIIPLSRPLFEWVLENLCKNAIDAMEGAGEISLTLSRSRDRVVLDVSDTGKGMTRAVQRNIFRPGFSTKSRGWGLGLSLSKRIIEQYHQGEITVLHSAPGKGTTFRISLPVRDKA